MSIAAVDDVIELLAGANLIRRVRSDKSAEDRYPDALARLRRLPQAIPDGAFDAQLSHFLERVSLSKHEGHDPRRDCVNLLTLHATKGLEFSHVYVIGVEDSELPGVTERKQRSAKEIEEARRLLYVGMTRTKARLIMTRCLARDGWPTGGRQFLDEMGAPINAPRAVRQLLS